MRGAELESKSVYTAFLLNHRLPTLTLTYVFYPDHKFCCKERVNISLSEMSGVLIYLILTSYRKSGSTNTSSSPRFKNTLNIFSFLIFAVIK